MEACLIRYLVFPVCLLTLFYLAPFIGYFIWGIAILLWLCIVYIDIKDFIKGLIKKW